MSTAQELNLNSFLLTDEKEINNREEKPSTREIMLDKLTKEVFSTKNIEVRTDLTQAQIDALAKGLLFADRFGSKVLKTLCNNIMKLSLSKDRKSRGEYISMSSSTLNRLDTMDNVGGLNARLWGE